MDASQAEQQLRALKLYVNELHELRKGKEALNK
jgi:hypothetical protein